MERTAIPMWSSFGLFGNSDSMDVGAPDVLVKLCLQPRRHAIGEHPFGERLQFELAPDGRKENGPAVEPALGDQIAGPFVIIAVRDDELELIVRPKVVEVLPPVLLRLAGAGTLDVEDEL